MTHAWQHAIGRACLNTRALLREGLVSAAGLQRLALSPLLHGDDMHLYYNMGSLLWKGVQLEQAMGSAGFGALVVVLALASQVATMGVTLAAEAVGYPDWAHQCAIGFSGVLFAMKPILAVGATGHMTVLNWEIPTKHAAWAELVLASLMSPHSSFVGHLGGIFAGLAYVRAARALTGRGNASPLELAAALGPRLDGRAAPGAFHGSGTTGGARRGSPTPAAAAGGVAYPASGDSGLRRRHAGGTGDAPWSQRPPAAAAVSARGGNAGDGDHDGDAALARRLQAEEDAAAVRAARIARFEGGR
jgi:membrane associated rhomboid family serine protease